MHGQPVKERGYRTIDEKAKAQRRNEQRRGLIGQAIATVAWVMPIQPNTSAR